MQHEQGPAAHRQHSCCRLDPKLKTSNGADCLHLHPSLARSPNPNQSGRLQYSGAQKLVFMHPRDSFFSGQRPSRWGSRIARPPRLGKHRVGHEMASVHRCPKPFWRQMPAGEYVPSESWTVECTQKYSITVMTFTKAFVLSRRVQCSVPMAGCGS